MKVNRKKTNNDGDKSAVANLEDARDTEPPKSSSNFTEEHQSLRINSTSAVFKKATQRHANIRENKGPSLGQFQVAVPRQRSPYALKFEDGSQEDTEGQEG